MARGDGYREKQLDLCREKIKTSQLINRLQDNALGKIKLDSVEQRSIEILLRKSVPDLSSVEMKHEGATPFALIPQQIEDLSAWEESAKPKTEH